MGKDDRNRIRLVVGGVWPIEAVADRPDVWLAEWRVYEIVHPDPDRVTRHLVGWIG